MGTVYTDSVIVLYHLNSIAVADIQKDINGKNKVLFNIEMNISNTVKKRILNLLGFFYI